jgi:hypothetical protein
MLSFLFISRVSRKHRPKLARSVGAQFILRKNGFFTISDPTEVVITLQILLLKMVI